MTLDWMASAGKDHLDLALSLCVDASGHVLETQLTQSSGVADFDGQVHRATRDWLYNEAPGVPRRCGTLRFYFGPGTPAWAGTPPRR
jgi:outer membrane biosynthesis protein TonB